jgi:hypothetical protein
MPRAWVEATPHCEVGDQDLHGRTDLQFVCPAQAARDYCNQGFHYLWQEIAAGGEQKLM